MTDHFQIMITEFKIVGGSKIQRSHSITDANIRWLVVLNNFTACVCRVHLPSQHCVVSFGDDNGIGFYSVPTEGIIIMEKVVDNDLRYEQEISAMV